MKTRISHFEHHAARAAQQELVALAQSVFPDFDADYLTDRLPGTSDPLLTVASHRDAWVGFKLGYRRGKCFYSWLGGVVPEHRDKGIATALMEAQHDRAKALGYQSVLTRTRSPNRAMLILNLRNGFEICGYETDPAGHAVVTQIKDLRG